MNFDAPVELVREAAMSSSCERLNKLARHESIFVRVRVAGNKHITEKIHRRLLCDHRPGVVLWALGNPRTTRDHFEFVLKNLGVERYDPTLHPVLASSRFATLEELRVLIRFNTWAVSIGVLNNHINRDPIEFRKIIVRLLPPKDKDDDAKWTDLEQLAHLRIFGTRLKLRDE